MKRLLLLKTGGSIVRDAPGASGRPSNQTTLDEFIRASLKSIGNHWGPGADADFITQEVANVDSSDIGPNQWTHIAHAIKEQYDAYDGFVITHGTNTMGYTAAALSFALPNLNKPVVITGSQLPYHFPGSDADFNLTNALRVALYPFDGGIRGVVCVFASQIITGTRVKKRSEFDLDAFQSAATSARLGSVGVGIQINKSNLDDHHAYLKGGAGKGRQLLIEGAFDPRLLSLTEFPGLRADTMVTICERLLLPESQALKGVVFRAFGAGDASTGLLPAFEFLRKREVPVVVTTQMPEGVCNFSLNDPGRELADRGLAIPAHDMSVEAITTKLMWLLGQKCSYEDVARRMLEDLHGEITIRDLT